MIKSSMTPPTVDQATIDHFVAKGRRERSRAFTAMIKALFSAPEAVETRIRSNLRSKTACNA